MKKYKIQHRESNRKGYITMGEYDYKWWCSESEDMYGYNSEKYDTIKDAEKDWVIPKSVKVKLVIPVVAKIIGFVSVILGIGAVCLALVGGLVVLLCCTWDYHTGQDTGYISAVDKMTFSDDRTIYIRRRPLDAQGYTTAEKDETTYCTTADRQEVIDKAYEAMASGKRVILVYDTPKPFGFRAIGHCNNAPITDIKYVEEK